MPLLASVSMTERFRVFQRSRVPKIVAFSFCSMARAMFPALYVGLSPCISRYRAYASGLLVISVTPASCIATMLSRSACRWAFHWVSASVFLLIRASKFAMIHIPPIHDYRVLGGALRPCGVFAAFMLSDAACRAASRPLTDGFSEVGSAVLVLVCEGFEVFPRCGEKLSR